MKRIHILYTTLIAGALLTSCGKGFLTNLAVNPNQPSASQASPNLVLSAALESTVGEVLGGDYNGQGLWLGNINFKGGYAISTPTLTYVLTNGSYNGCWGNLYYNISNYNFILTSVKGTQNNDYYAAIARIMEAWDFAYLVDNFNNVPYTQAMQAPAVITPAYDSGQVVYTGIVSSLDTAINLINANLSNTSEVNPAGFDVMFKGDMSLWASFANTLKLRLLLQQSEMTGRSSYITQEVAATASTPYLGPGQNAFVQPGYSDQNGPNNGDQQNPFYGFLGFTVNGTATGFYSEQGAGQAAIDFLNRTNDGFRLPLMYDSVPGDSPATYSAVYFGQLPTGSISNLGHYAGSVTGQGFLQSPTAPAVLMSAGEALLLQAEATERGWLPGGDAAAQNLYNEGVTESFLYLAGAYNGLDASGANAAATAYLAQTGVQDVSWAGSMDQKIRAIIMQKWIAWNVLNPMISWNDYRRFQDMTNGDGTTGWPDVPLSKNPDLGSVTHMPFRVLYPNSEYQLNGANVNAQGTPTANSTIFWMP